MKMMSKILSSALMAAAALMCAEGAEHNSSVPMRWMFAAKLAESDPVEIRAKVKGFKSILNNCTQYNQSGFGVARHGLIHHLSDYDVIIFFDAKDAETTDAQATCMVEYLQANPNLQESLLQNLTDVAEVAIALPDDKHSIRRNEITQAGFFVFVNETDRISLGNEFDTFTQGLLESKFIKVTSSAFGNTVFPSSYLKEWPQDVHYANWFSFRSVFAFAKFWAALFWEKAAPGNFFVSNESAPDPVQFAKYIFFRPVLFRF